jgi:hypothetical protein
LASLRVKSEEARRLDVARVGQAVENGAPTVVLVAARARAPSAPHAFAATEAGAEAETACNATALLRFQLLRLFLQAARLNVRGVLGLLLGELESVLAREEARSNPFLISRSLWFLTSKSMWSITSFSLSRTPHSSHRNSRNPPAGNSGSSGGVARASASLRMRA